MLTVNDSTFDEAQLSAASRALAKILWGPFATRRLFHVRVHGVPSLSVARSTLSTNHLTVTTPTASAAVADNVTVPASRLPPAGDVTDTVGLVVSTVNDRVAGVASVEPDGLMARAANVCVPIA